MARRIRPTLHGTLLLVTVLVLLAMAAAPARQTYDLQRQIQHEEERLEELRRQNALLEERLERLEDPEYLEKLAREQLGLVAPGETAYVVVDPPGATETVSPDDSGEDLPWYRRAWRKIKGIFD